MKIRIVQWDEKPQEEVHCICYRTPAVFLRYEYSHEKDRQGWDKIILCSSSRLPQSAFDLHPDLVISPYEYEGFPCWKIEKGMRTPWNGEGLVGILMELASHHIPLEQNRILEFSSCLKTKTEQRINSMLKEASESQIWWFEQTRHPEDLRSDCDDPRIHHFFLRKKSEKDILCHVREKEA